MVTTLYQQSYEGFVVDEKTVVNGLLMFGVTGDGLL